MRVFRSPGRLCGWTISISISSGVDGDLLKRLHDRTPDVVVVATIRRSQVQDREGSLADPSLSFLTDPSRVHEINLDAELDESELAEAHRLLENRALLDAVRARGWSRRVPDRRSATHSETATRDRIISTLGRHDHWLVSHRIQRPLPEEQLRRLWTATLPAQLAASFGLLRPEDQDDRFKKACLWATAPIADLSSDVHDVALVRLRRDGYEPDDYVVPTSAVDGHVNRP